jgi:hypothetical protein
MLRGSPEAPRSSGWSAPYIQKLKPAVARCNDSFVHQYHPDLPLARFSAGDLLVEFQQGVAGRERRGYCLLSGFRSLPFRSLASISPMRFPERLNATAALAHGRPLMIHSAHGIMFRAEEQEEIGANLHRSSGRFYRVHFL